MKTLTGQHPSSEPAWARRVGGWPEYREQAPAIMDPQTPIPRPQQGCEATQGTLCMFWDPLSTITDSTPVMISPLTT